MFYPQKQSKNIFSRMIKLCLFGTLYCGVINFSPMLFGSGVGEMESPINIEFHRDAKNSQEISRYLRCVRFTLLTALRVNNSQTPLKTCRLVVGDSNYLKMLTIKSTRKTVYFFLSEQFFIEKQRFQVTCELINNLLCGLVGMPTAKYALIPAWLTTGLYAKIEKSYYKRGKLVMTSAFPGLRALLLANKLPSLRQSLYTKVTPVDGAPSFALYCELCHFFLNQVLRKNKPKYNLIVNLIRKQAVMPVADHDAFESVILTSLTDGKNLDQWFRNILRHTLVNNFMPYSAKKFALIWEKVLQMENAVKFVDFLKNYIESKAANKNKNLQAKIKLLEELQYSSPALIAPVICDLVKELKLVEKKPTPETVVRAIKLLEQGQAALKQQGKIEAYLDKVKNAKMATPQRFKNLLEFLSKVELRRQSLLEDYLEKQEKKFE